MNDENHDRRDIANQLQPAIDNPPEDWSSWYELVTDSLAEIKRLRAELADKEGTKPC